MLMLKLFFTGILLVLLSPGDRFYIRILLNHVKNAQGYNDLRTTASSSTTEVDIVADDLVGPPPLSTTTTHFESGSVITTFVDKTCIGGRTTTVTRVTIVHATYKATCTELGLLMDDEEWDRFLAEAATFSSTPMMRQLFATMLIECLT